MKEVFQTRELVCPNRRELLGGAVCWLCWQIVFPLLLLGLFRLVALKGELAELLYQVANFVFTFTLTVLVFRKFLWRSAAPVRGNGRYLLLSVIWGYAIYYAISFFLSLLLQLLPVQPENANNALIHSLLSEHKLVMTLCVVLISPVYEELLLRGAIFAPLCRRSPLLAYLVSASAFALLHVIGFIGVQDALQLLLSFLQYLPAGVALGWMYQRTRSIYGPILLHMLINSAAVVTLLLL